MIRSLFSGASGMKNHQIRLDVIGNNVANVNTTGFKGSRANFQDTLYQWARMPSAGSSSGVGGINPSQVGLGVLISSITNDTGGGGLQSSSRTMDLGIDGNGWFILSIDGKDVNPDSDSVRYTREGIFSVDNAGNLLNSSGYNVCDVNGKIIQLDLKGNGTENIGIATINIEQDGTISYSLMNGKVYDRDNLPDSGELHKIGLAMFANQEGLQRDGSNMFKSSPASGKALPGSKSTFGAANEGGYGTINSGYLEMSNVDLTDEFISMITTQRGYQANSRTVTTSDSILEELLNIKR